ncbi:uncharacterized protein LOC127081678 [Lathyrus oleraceus]|uniref:uncharacterized protein LOC127081678 n=1 Tax=Pisum sativum TaxID=3888 RepID=UPI0021CF90B7|nr:uncharacterized protein LOC127081678 [Pisum sativum]
MAQNYVDLASWRLYFDGSRHKHGAGIGGVIVSPNGIPAKFKYKIEGICTNNEPEYESLITGLELLLELGSRNVEIMGDSELVIKQAATNVNQETVIDFVQSYIICRFSIPETITTDQGSIFTSRKVQEFAKKPRNWHKTLDQALWACRTSPIEATGTTPFRLTYGHDAVLPVEIQVQAVRTQRQCEIPSEDYWSMMTDELVDVDEERMLAIDSLQRQKEKVARAYNKRVKGKVFVVDDLVWSVILPMDRNDKMLGKWSPNWEGPFKVVQAFSNNAYEVEELAPDRRILRVNGKYLKKYRPLLQEVRILAD